MLHWLLILLLGAVPVSYQDRSEFIEASGVKVPRIWAQLGLPNQEASSRESRVIIQASSLPEVGAAQFDLVFAPELFAEPVIMPSTILGNALLESNQIEPGRLRIAFVSSEPLPEHGELMKIEFPSIDKDERSTSVSVDSVKLENVKAWRLADSSEVDIRIGPSEQSSFAKTSAVEPKSAPVSSLVSTPEPAFKASSSSSPIPFVVNIPESIQVTVSSPIEIRIELPGWLYFIVGTIATMIIGLLLALVYKRN